MQWIKGLLFPDDGPQGSRDNIYARTDAMAEAVPAGSRGLLFLPYLLGERSPLWDPTGKGCFVGLTMGHGRAEMIRAVMEGVALNLKGILDAFNAYTDEAAIALIGGGPTVPCGAKFWPMFSNGKSSCL